MSLSNLSKHDAITLLELIHASLSCVKEEEFRKLNDRLSRLIAYDFAICGLARTNSKSVVESYDIINLNYPAEWLSTYIAKGFHKLDPIVRENFTRFNLQCWADTYKKNSIPKEFVSTASDFGLKEGYTHGVRSLKGHEGSLFSISGRHLERHPRTETILRHIIPHFHQVITRLSKQLTGKKHVTLSPREREVLRWISCGKNSWETSAILGISENTVVFHINNIKQKLDAVNRLHAVAIALEQGLIDIE